MLAVVTYFGGTSCEWRGLSWPLARSEFEDRNQRLAYLILVATIPGESGFFFSSFFEQECASRLASSNGTRGSYLRGRQWG